MNKLGIKAGVLALIVAQSACADDSDTSAAVPKAVADAPAVTAAAVGKEDGSADKADMSPDTGLKTRR